MSEVIDRACRAMIGFQINDARRPDPPLTQEELEQIPCNDYERDLVRTIIEALREPTRQMVLGAREAVYLHQDAEMAWRAMIDEALR